MFEDISFTHMVLGNIQYIEADINGAFLRTAF